MYDIIIVGGGTAGSVLASRLADSKNLNILVLEAGPDASSHKHTSAPLDAVHLFGSELDWKYLTEPQVHLAVFVDVGRRAERTRHPMQVEHAALANVDEEPNVLLASM